MRLPDLSLPRRAATVTLAVVAFLTAGLLAWVALAGGDGDSAAIPAAQDRPLTVVSRAGGFSPSASRPT